MKRQPLIRGSPLLPPRPLLDRESTEQIMWAHKAQIPNGGWNLLLQVHVSTYDDATNDFVGLCRKEGVVSAV